MIGLQVGEKMNINEEVISKEYYVVLNEKKEMVESYASRSSAEVRVKFLSKETGKEYSYAVMKYE